MRIDPWSHWREMSGTQELQELGTLLWLVKLTELYPYELISGVPSLFCAVSFLGQKWGREGCALLGKLYLIHGLLTRG